MNAFRLLAKRLEYLLLMKFNISKIHENRTSNRRSSGVCCCLLQCHLKKEEKPINLINFSKKSALTVSQQPRINQQLVIGGIWYALAGLRQ